MGRYKCRRCGKWFEDIQGHTQYASRPHIVYEANVERKGGTESVQGIEYFCSWKCIARYATAIVEKEKEEEKKK